MTGRRCRRFRSEIALHVAGDLPGSRVARLERHLATCPACRELARRLEEDRLALGRLAPSPGEAPGRAPFEEQALRRIRRAVARRIDELEEVPARPSAGRLSVRRLVPLAAALVLATLAVMLWGPFRAALRTGAPATGRPEQVASREPSPPLPAAPSPVLPQAAPAAPEPGPGPRPQEKEPTAPAPSGSHRSSAQRRGARPPAPVATPSEPLLIQVVSDQPDIVYYWLTEPEETTRESTSD